MFKGDRKYYWILGLVFTAIVVLQYMQPRPVSWRRTYLAKDKIPFGCYAIYNILEGTYANKVALSKQTIYNLYEENDYTNTSLIIVNDQVQMSRLDVQTMHEFIAEGNKVCIVASEHTGILADTFKLKNSYDWNVFNNNSDSAMNKPGFRARYIQPKNNVFKEYAYPEAAGDCYFTVFDTTLFSIVSVNHRGGAVLIKAKIGNGELYLGTLPDVFTNIFVVDHINRPYVYNLLSALKNDTILWDEYYKTYNPQKEHMLRYIFDSEALTAAYSLLLLGLLVFMIFALKRRQKAIPIVTPLQNSTLEFVDVVGHVYFNSRNHKHIAAEKINYFYFDIRTKFYLNTNELNEEFYLALSKLSGLEVMEIRGLFKFCERLKRAGDLNEDDLLELNKRINNFKQKSIR